MQHFTVGKEKFRVGDTITLRPPTVNENPFIARIHEVRKTGKSLRLYVSWFYRPEEARGGRKGFHGEKELSVGPLRLGHALRGERQVQHSLGSTNFDGEGV